MLRLITALFLSVAISAGVLTAERDALKLLAIGNSFSEDATRLLPQVAKAGDKKLVIGRASIGGCSLERHARHLREAEAGDEKGRAYRGFADPKTNKKSTVTLIEALQSEAWEIVTLQQLSHQSYKLETFQPYADELIAAIRNYAPSAEIVIHQTWAYRDDHPHFQKGDAFSPAKMHEGLTSTYQAFADGKNFRILPVGDAFNSARQTPRWTFVRDTNYDFKHPPEDRLPANDQGASLHQGWQWGKAKEGKPALGYDGIHANTTGQYLGACVWYLQLFNAAEIPSAYLPQGMAPEDAADLRQHALAAVQAERIRESHRPAATPSP